MQADSCDSCSLDAVLAALETEPPEEVLEAEGGWEETVDRTLSTALTQLHDFAEAKALTDLSQWAIAELHGYAADANYPSYRTVSLQYFDRAGQAIPSLKEQYGTWPLLHGVQTLELHVRHGLTLKLPSQILDFLSQACDRAVFGGHVEPGEIKQLLNAIRNEAIGRLKSA